MNATDYYLKCRASLFLNKGFTKNTDKQIDQYEHILRSSPGIISWEVNKSQHRYLIKIKQAINLRDLQSSKDFFETLIKDTLFSKDLFTIEGIYQEESCKSKITTEEILAYFLKLKKICPKINVVILDRIKAEIYNNHKDSIRTRLEVNLFLALHKNSKFVMSVLEEYIHNSIKDRSWDGFLYFYERKYGFLIGSEVKAKKLSYKKNTIKGNVF
jgi:hypothetical protein